ncbi:MAG: orotidine-5'-phosphate decarboxylase, partial [Pyrinomonadaceae bacterium]
MKDKLIIALDVETAAQARELVTRLRDVAGMFKVGSQLFTAEGPQIVREIVQGGGRVFLDLKFHDIPNVVASAAVEATRLGVSLFTIHAVGGREMLKRATEAVAQAAERENLARPNVIAVTVLTSADKNTLAEVGIDSGLETQVRNCARLAEECGV